MSIREEKAFARGLLLSLVLRRSLGPLGSRLCVQGQPAGPVVPRDPRKVTTDSAGPQGQEQALTSLILRSIAGIKEQCRAGEPDPELGPDAGRAPAR